MIRHLISSVFIRLPAVLHEAPAGLVLSDPQLLPQVEPASDQAGLGQTAGENKLHQEKHPADSESRGAASGGEQSEVQQELPAAQEEENNPHWGGNILSFTANIAVKY